MTRKTSLLRFALILPVIALFALSCNQSPEAKFEKEMTAFMQDISCPGLSVAVVKDNQIIYNHSFGVKSLETNEPVTNESIFRIASISKSFSATSMMQLIEAGKVSLDTDVSDLMGFPVRNPKFPERVITLRMLMSHTSSLNDNEGYFTLDVINPEKNENWANCYNDYEPGTGYEYCNLNFNMTGTFIERISGERFDQYVKHHVLDPLSLYGGYCVDSLDASKFVMLYAYNDSTKTMDPEPEAYAPRREQITNYVMGYSTPVFSPTGGMKISALDLAKYMMMHMNYGTSPLNNVTIISEESSKTMQTPLSSNENYGLALNQTDRFTPGITLVGHTGGAYGLRSAMYFNPAEKYGFTIISSGSKETATNGQDILRGSIELMYNNFIK
ncbi:MAG: serine hydrolase [Bacteroidales bacterium]|nr:serine hydrolase [Bacteroidales bacterium]MDD3201907.1 serine hydrolase [Bacteroidales bacterium]